MTKGEIVKLIFFILIVEIVGSAGTIFTTPAISTWYATLNKPSFNPPNWLFGPVWTTLFLLMGVSLYLVWQQRKNKKAVGLPFAVFTIQLILNVLWLALFFGAHSPFLGFIDIILLIGAIGATMWQFAKVSKPSALLLVPYLAWTIFAAVLNFNILVLN